MQPFRQRRYQGRMEYAIVDIETTGGYAAGSSITEIAIRIHDGTGVTDRFDSLVQPEHAIPVYIQSLTGIHEEMLREAPSFGAIAAEVFRLLSGRVFVAHNVNFDYSFLKQHLAIAGYELDTQRLCTVRMSRKIRPGLRSYSLGRLCESLDIPVYERHRAGGDADATAILFSRLLQWDTAGHIAGMLRKNATEHNLPAHVPREQFEALPQSPGIYYFKDKGGKVIYVGKATNIRKRVATHFTGHNPSARRQHFLQEIYSISHERCGTELMALLLEATEIKRLWPRYNNSLKRFEPRFGLYTYEDLTGFRRLAIGKLSNTQLAVHTFTTNHEALNLLHKLVRHFQLCPELCRLGPCTGDCREGQEGMCREQDPVMYNEQVGLALQQLRDQLPGFAIVDKGRHEEEYSCIWVEEGTFYGMGYISRHSDITDAEGVREQLQRYTGNHNMMQLVCSYADKYPHKVRHFKQARQAQEFLQDQLPEEDILSSC